MIDDIFDRAELPSPDNKIEFFTDGNTNVLEHVLFKPPFRAVVNDDYTHILPEYYAESCMNYGQLIKIRKGGRVVDREKRAIYGTPEMEDIETTDIENFNGILRERIGRLVRKTKCFSKEKQRSKCALHLFQFYWNFINEFKRDTSPAMVEGLTDHLWNWREFLMYHYAV